MAEPQLASNNPFRRKDSAPAPPPPSLADADSSPSPAVSPVPPTGASFREQLRALPKSAEAPPSTTFQKPKLVKKVRVQSPPPSSPESTDGDFDARYPASGPRLGESDSESSDDEQEDPFKSDAPSPASLPTAGHAEQATSLQRPPPNPFQKTLGDLGQAAKDGGQASAGGAGNAGTPAGKGSLDVDSFRRLLMTGQAGASGAVPPAPAAAAHPPQQQAVSLLAGPATDSASITDASSVSRQSIFDAAHAAQETPRTSHEISEGEDDQSDLIHGPQAPPQRTTLRKKPPPPSSRHGKLIKIQLRGKDGEQSGESTPRPSAAGAATSSSGPTSEYSVRPSSSSSDLNKPLPPPPARGTLEGPQSVFDQEAAGKIPEVDVDPDAPDEDIPPPRPPTPPNASHATSKPNPKKPAPPPRRQTHSRTESMAPSVSSTQGITPSAADADEADTTPPRSSFESNRSRTSSVRLSINAPAPPPPRRPNHTSRPSNSFISPSALSFTSMASSTSSPSDADRSPMQWPQHAPGHSNAADSAAPGAGRSAPLASGANLGAAHAKLSPPPLPPARHTSVRSKEGRASHAPGGRPPSVSSLDTTSRKISREGAAPPPPPPPRQRGGSRGSTDSPRLGPRRSSIDSVRIMGGSVAEGVPIPVLTEEPGEDVPPPQDSAATDILADLDALRREVDALRGQYAQPGSAGR